MPLQVPPELIDRILGHLGDDLESLRAVALVSKAWAGWCQAHLFKSVHLTPSALSGWLENVPPGFDGPASHTRTLTLEEYRLKSWINPQYLDLHLSTLPSFSGVRSLSLIQWDATLFNGVSPEPYFCHFGKSLRAVILRFCKFDPVIFFDLLSLLPNVDDLEIANPLPHSYTLDIDPNVPETTPNFRGTLSLVDLNSGHLILRTLAKFPLHFSTIRIKGSTYYGQEAYQLLLTSGRDTLVTFYFEESYRDRPLPDVSLESCNKLEEVHMFLHSFTKLSRPLEILFSSITSQKLRTISLTFRDFVEDDDPDRENEPEYDDDEDEGVDKAEDEDEDNDADGDEGEDEWRVQRARTVQWGPWDTMLSPLAHQALDVGGKLSLQLNIRRVSPTPLEPDHLFPNFLGHGGLVEIKCT